MKFNRRLKKIETNFVRTKFCRCRQHGGKKNSIEADSFNELMDKIFQGICATCKKPHVPPGYTFGDAWIEGLNEVDSEGLDCYAAELSASKSFLKVFYDKCKNCGEVVENLTTGCKQCPDITGNLPSNYNF
jgi:hypothetical protein